MKGVRNILLYNEGFRTRQGWFSCSDRPGSEKVQNGNRVIQGSIDVFRKVFNVDTVEGQKILGQGILGLEGQGDIFSLAESLENHQD